MIILDDTEPVDPELALPDISSEAYRVRDGSGQLGAGVQEAAGLLELIDRSWAGRLGDCLGAAECD